MFSCSFTGTWLNIMFHTLWLSKLRVVEGKTGNRHCLENIPCFWVSVLRWGWTVTFPAREKYVAWNGITHILVLTVRNTVCKEIYTPSVICPSSQGKCEADLSISALSCSQDSSLCLYSSPIARGTKEASCLRGIYSEEKIHSLFLPTQILSGRTHVV